MAPIKVYEPVIVNDVMSPVLPWELIKRIKSLEMGRASQIKSKGLVSTTTGTGGIYGEFQEDEISEITKQMWYDPVAVVVRSLTPDGVYILADQEEVFALPVVNSISLSDQNNGIYVTKFAEVLAAAFKAIIPSLSSDPSQRTFQFYFSLGREKVREGQLPTVFLSAPTQLRAHLFPHPILLVLKARYEKEIKFNANAKKVLTTNQFSDWDMDEEDLDPPADDQDHPQQLPVSAEEQKLFTDVIDKHPGTKAIQKAFLNTKNREKTTGWRLNRLGKRDNTKHSQRSVYRSLPTEIGVIHIDQNANNLVGAGIVGRGDIMDNPPTIPTNAEEERAATGKGKKEEAYYLKLVDDIITGKVHGVSYSYPDWVISAICTTLNVPFSLVTEDRDQIEEYSTQAGKRNLFFFSKTQNEAKAALLQRIIDGGQKSVATTADNNHLEVETVASTASGSDLSSTIWKDLLYDPQFFSTTPRGKEMLEEMRIRRDDTSPSANPTQYRIPRTTNREDVIYRLLGGFHPVNKKLPHDDRMNEETTREWTRLVLNSFDGKLPSPKKTFRSDCSKRGKTVDILAMNTEAESSDFYIRTSTNTSYDTETDYTFLDTREQVGWGLTVERVVGSRLNYLRSDYFAKTFLANNVGLASEYVIYDLRQVLDCGTGRFVASDLSPRELSLGEYISLKTTREKDSGPCVVQGLLALYEANVKLGFVHGNATCDTCCSVRFNQSIKPPSFSINEQGEGEWDVVFKFVPTTTPVFIPEEMGKSRIITETGGWFPHSMILETNLIDEKLIPRPQGPKGPDHTTLDFESYESSFELDVFIFISTCLIRRLQRRKTIIDGLLGKNTQPRMRRNIHAMTKVDDDTQLIRAARPATDNNVYRGIVKTIASLKSFASRRVPADHPKFVFLSTRMDLAFVEAFRKNQQHAFMPDLSDTKADAATFIDVLNCVISTFGLDQRVVLSPRTTGPWPRPTSQALLKTSNNNISSGQLVDSMDLAIRNFLVDAKNPFQYLSKFYDVQMWFAENEAVIPTDHAIIRPARLARRHLVRIQSERIKMFREILKYLLGDSNKATLDNIEDVLSNPSITSLPRYVMTETGRFIRKRDRLMDRDNFLPIDLCVEIAQHPGLNRTRQNITRIYEAVGPLNST